MILIVSYLLPTGDDISGYEDWRCCVQAISSLRLTNREWNNVIVQQSQYLSYFISRMLRRLHQISEQRLYHETLSNVERTYTEHNKHWSVALLMTFGTSAVTAIAG